MDGLRSLRREPITDDIERLALYLGPLELTSAYLLTAADGTWVLLDTGAPGYYQEIYHAAMVRFERAPAAIILSHGHFDHIGNARRLIEQWNVPAYAHPLEIPYLTGKSTLPPLDPSVGGFVSRMAYLFPPSGTDLGDRIHAIPADGTVPYLPDWRWYHTPGHTPGHLSFFRARDRILLAVDALNTTNQRSPAKALANTRELHGPPPYATSDWQQAKASVVRLAELEPVLIIAGHGAPYRREDAAQALHDLADHFDSEIPAHGRYVNHPARTDEHGIVSLPPPVFDPVPVVAGIGMATLGALALRRQRVRALGTR